MITQQLHVYIDVPFVEWSQDKRLPPSSVDRDLGYIPNLPMNGCIYHKIRLFHYSDIHIALISAHDALVLPVKEKPNMDKHRRKK